MRGVVDSRRKRLLFRSLRRGTKESDLIVGGFAAAHLESMGPTQLDRFEALLERSDPELLGWVVGGADVPAAFDNDVTAMLVAYGRALRSGA